MNKLVALLCLLTLAAVSTRAQTTPPPAAATAADAVIISAAGVSITRAEFEMVIKTLPASYQEYASGAGRRVFAADLLRMKLLSMAGAKAGLENDPAILKELTLLRENLVANAMLSRIEQGITISDADLRKAYAAQQSEFERVKASHILIAFKGSAAVREGRPVLSEEQAEAKAQELRARIVQGKATLEELAKSESDDTQTGANGGDLGEFIRGQMVPEFENAAFDGQVGKLTPVVRTQFGYHVLRVDAKVTTSFEEAKPALETKERTARLQAELGKLVENAKPVYAPDYFGP